MHGNRAAGIGALHPVVGGVHGLLVAVNVSVVGLNAMPPSDVAACAHSDDRVGTPRQRELHAALVLTRVVRAAHGRFDVVPILCIVAAQTDGPLVVVAGPVCTALVKLLVVAIVPQLHLVVDSVRAEARLRLAVALPRDVATALKGAQGFDPVRRTRRRRRERWPRRR